MRYIRNPEGNAAPEPTWTWRTKVLFAIVLCVVGALLITIYFMMKERKHVQAKAAEVSDTWKPPIVEYPEIEEPTDLRPPEGKMFSAPSGDAAAAAAAGPQPISPAILSARDSTIVLVAANDEARDGTRFAGSSGGGCRLPAGTVIKAFQESATTNTNATVIIARVGSAVLGDDGCSGIMAGALFVGKVEQGANFGAERSNVAFHTLEQDGRSIDLQSAAADAMGKGGVPGDVDHHTAQIGFRVAVATLTGILDSGVSAVVGSYGAIAARESSRAIDKWADQALNQPPTLTTDPSKRRVPMTIILEKAIDV